MRHRCDRARARHTFSSAGAPGHHAETRRTRRTAGGSRGALDGAALGLWRQDDNGNRVLIRAFTDAEAARAELARFEALQHKQIYWLQERPG